MSSQRGGAAALLLLVVMACLGYGFLWSPGQLPFSPHSDDLAYNLSSKAALHRASIEGHGLPFWRSDQLSGGPALTQPQALYTYPFHALFHVLPPESALGPTIFVHVLLAGIALWLLGGALGLGPGPRLFMGAAGMFNFKLLMAVYAGWTPIIPSITLVPLLFAAVLALLQRPTAGRTLSLAAVGALCLHTGHLQLVYYAGLCLAVIAAARIVSWWRQGKRTEARRVLGGLLLAAVLAVGLTAYLLVPLAAEAPLASRSHAAHPYLAHLAIGWEQYFTLLHPEALGSVLDGSYPRPNMWEDVAYFGLLPLLLAGAGAVLGRRRWPVPWLVGAFGLALLLATDTALLRFMFEAVPGYRFFRGPGRMLFIAADLGIVLAGIGLQEILDRIQARWEGHPAAGRLSIFIVSGLVLAIALEGLHYAGRYLHMVPHETALPNTDYAAVLTADTTPHRVAPVGRATVNYGWAGSMGLQLVTGYEPYNFHHYQVLADILRWGEARPPAPRVWTDIGQIARHDLLDVLGARYLVSQVSLEQPWLELVGSWPAQPLFVFYRGLERGPVKVYRNRNARERAFFVDTVLGTPLVLETLERTRVRDVAIVEAPAEASTPSPASPQDAVEIVAAAGGQLDLRVSCGTRRFLVMSEVWHPGWQATLDGEPLALLRTDYALLGAWIPPGSHELSLRFQPLYWNLGLGLSLLSLAAWLALLVRIRRRPTARG